MENEFEFHELDDLNPKEPEDDPDSEQETSFTDVTEREDFGGKLFSITGTPKGKLTESVNKLRNSVRELKEQIQKTKMENISREAKRVANIEAQRKKLGRKEKMVKEANAKAKARKEEMVKEGRRVKQSGNLFSLSGTPKGKMESIKKEATTLQKQLDKLTKEEILDKEADDKKEETLERELTEEEEWEIFFNTGSFTEETPVVITERRTEAIRRKLIYRDCNDFFSNILDLEPRCTDPKFVDNLIDRGILQINRTFGSDLVTEYKVRYLSGEFNTVDRTLDNSDLIRDGIRLYYDEWTEERLKKVMKKAGIATAVGLSIIALITGLSIGLTRGGSNMVHQAKKYEKWKKLNPSKKTDTVNWTKLEKATGKVVIFTGEYIVIIITVGTIYFYSK